MCMRNKKVWGKSLCYSNGSKSTVEWKVLRSTKKNWDTKYTIFKYGKWQKSIKSLRVAKFFLKSFFVEGSRFSIMIPFTEGYEYTWVFFFAIFSHNITIGLGNIRNTLCRKLDMGYGKHFQSETKIGSLQNYYYCTTISGTQWFTEK